MRGHHDGWDDHDQFDLFRKRRFDRDVLAPILVEGENHSSMVGSGSIVDMTFEFLRPAQHLRWWRRRLPGGHGTNQDSGNHSRGAAAQPYSNRDMALDNNPTGRGWNSQRLSHQTYSLEHQVVVIQRNTIAASASVFNGQAG